MPLDFYARKLQVALFLSTLDLSDRLDLAVAIRESSGGVLNAEPLMLPVPDDAPPMIPRLRVKDTEGTRTCQVTPGRIDLWFEPEEEHRQQEDLEHIVRSQFELTSRIWNQLQEQFNAGAHRVGFVSQLVADTEDANSLLRDAFLRTSHFNASDRLEVHVLHKMDIGEYSVNRWVRLRAFPSSSGADENGRLAMEVDINTLPENPLDISRDTLSRFSGSALDLLQETKSTFTPSTPKG